MNKTTTIRHTTERTKKRKFGKSAISILFGIAIFTLGFGLGDGSIRFGGVATQNVDLPSALDYSSVDEVYDSLRLSFDGELNVTALLDGLKSGLTAAADDPYTEYLNEEQIKEFNEGLNGTFSGIGAELSQEDNAVVIVAPIAGFPAAQAGLLPNDVIVEIDGESAIGISVFDAVKKIRGPEGSDVVLKILRASDVEIEFTITRAQIKIASVEYKMASETIGLITISRFSEDTTKLTREAAAVLKRQGATGVILDLRNNPGGLLDAAVDVSSIWLPKGTTVLREKRGNNVIRTFSAKGNPAFGSMPTVVLINEGSASASEIVAGALSDNGAATLIGVTSFGKGSVQQIDNLHGGGALKVTIARWYTPNDKNIDKEGLTPDKEVQRTAEDYANERDPQLDAALNLLN